MLRDEEFTILIPDYIRFVEAKASVRLTNAV